MSSQTNNEMILIYEIPENKDQIRIFGDKFVETNKSNCKLIINGEEKDLIPIINIERDNESDRKKKNLEIKLIEINPIVNMEYMFYECLLLSPLSNLSRWDTSKVINMSNLFSKCYFILSLPDISGWDTSNVEKMDFMFFQCYSLTSLPDISKWNTSNVTHMNNLFR